MDDEEKDLFKGKHDTFKKGLVQKIAKRKKDNLKKINKIRIKTKKIWAIRASAVTKNISFDALINLHQF